MIQRIERVFRKDSCYKVFFMSLLMSGLAYGIYKGMLDNYLVEICGIGQFERGVIEFFRELPGFLLVFILAALYMMSAEQIYKIGAVIMLAGMALMAVVSPAKIIVTIAICTYSLGEHIELGMKNTLSLEYSKEGEGGEALGLMNATYQIGTLFGFGVVITAFTLTGAFHPYKQFFIISAVLMAIAMTFSLRVTGKSETDKSKSRFYFRRKFSKFYMLEVFYGARKQVFFTFGPYVLILFYKADAKIISLLFAISAISSYFFAPMIGRIIDKLGYKIVMISDTIILVFVCMAYAYAHHFFPMPVAFVICCVNYVLDSIISLASMASNVYVQDISDSPEEVRATISTGISVNHLISIFIALFGGWVWQVLGMEKLFILSALLGLCNSAYAATIKTSKDK